MGKYCPECKMNFSDSFDECVYCGSLLLYGMIESNEDNQPKEKNIFEMTDEEILNKYQSYKKNIEKQTGTILSDKEFITGLKNARRENLNTRLTEINVSIERNEKTNLITCPYCNSNDTKKISTTSKITHTVLFGIFSMSRNGKNFHCNQCGANF